MLGLPVATELHKQLPKKLIYERFSLNASEKNAIFLFTIIVPIIANIGETNSIAKKAFFINVYCIKSKGNITSSKLYITSIFIASFPCIFNYYFSRNF